MAKRTYTVFGTTTLSSFSLTTHNKQTLAYTVIGLWGDNRQPWIAHVDAKNPDDAAAKGIRKTYNRGKNGGELEDLFVVEVIAGTHLGLMNNQPDTVVSLKDLANKAIVVRHNGKVCPKCTGE